MAVAAGELREAEAVERGDLLRVRVALLVAVAEALGGAGAEGVEVAVGRLRERVGAAAVDGDGLGRAAGAVALEDVRRGLERVLRAPLEEGAGWRDDGGVAVARGDVDRREGRPVR